MSAYYNEIDPYAAQWLRNLISTGHIAPGYVDERSILDVHAFDLLGFTQCHFFAGIGVWSAALRGAGWPDDRPVWTGSCPCQPFSAAGKGGGFADERHLWPAWAYLIGERRPPIVFGEQVASKDGYGWLDLVQADLEGMGYACGAVVSPAAGFGAPHGRHRTYFVADAPHRDDRRGGARGWRLGPTDGFAVGGMDDVNDARPQGRGGVPERADQRTPRARGVAGVMAEPDGGDARAEGLRRSGQHGQRPSDAGACHHIERPGPTNGVWRDADWLRCRDDKWRPVEPGAFPLAHGAPARVGRLRAYGNAICLPHAQAFIEAAMSVTS
ncbi:MAG: DNA cytosine methyltransferase [Patescibacteria group bacterium]|nr:DNA cytosine methyltransferase [Patescibacteria group bacterium]